MAVAFYDPAADRLVASQWLLSEQPEDLDQGIDVSAAQVQLAQTFDVFESGDFAVDTAGALWQATARAYTASAGDDLRTVHVVRIGPGAKVVAEAGFSYLLLETGGRVLLETGGGILLEASGVRIVARQPRCHRRRRRAGHRPPGRQREPGDPAHGVTGGGSTRGGRRACPTC